VFGLLAFYLGKLVNFYLKKYGLGFTLKFAAQSVQQYAAAYLGTYTKITYPASRVGVSVRPRPFWKLLEAGLWELNCIKYICDTVKKPCTILDVGAWVGPYTLLFSKLMGDSGNIYAFEPDPEAFDELRANVQRNALSNVHLEKLCIADSEGRANLRVGQESSLSSILGDRGKEIPVQTITLDKYCQENGILPDAIKIDVEGAERLVIEGSRTIIRRHSPWVLLEFHAALMSKEERKRNWGKIVASAKKVTLIGDDSNRYVCGSEVKFMPESEYFHVLIRY